MNIKSTLRSVLYFAVITWLPVYVTGGDYGYSGYGGVGFSGYPMPLIYPALYQPSVNYLPYQTPSFYNHYDPSLSYFPFSQQYYHRNPIFIPTQDLYGGGIFQDNLVLNILLIFFLLAVFAPMLISSLTMSNDILQ